MKFYLYCVFAAIGFFLSSCEKESNPTPVPLVPVDFAINLTLQEYIPLLDIGGYVYDNRGYKGIIIYRQSNDMYLALERACTHQPRTPCERVKVDNSGLFLIDECCGSTFDFAGNPTGEPAAFPLLQYETFLEGNFLNVRNTL